MMTMTVGAASAADDLGSADEFRGFARSTQSDAPHMTTCGKPEIEERVRRCRLARLQVSQR
jgi:hypothetical protein